MQARGLEEEAVLYHPLPLPPGLADVVRCLPGTGLWVSLDQENQF